MLIHDSQTTVVQSRAVLPAGDDEAALDLGIFETLRTTLAASALLEIYAVFLSDTRQRIAGLGESKESKAPDSLPRIVHAIHGSAGMIGATRIAALAERLESDPNASTKLLRACEQLQATLRAEGVAL